MRPLVLGSIGIGGSAELEAAVVGSALCIAEGADGLELRFSDDSTAVADQVRVADQIGAVCAVPIFIRATRPMAGRDHQLIVAFAAWVAGRRSSVLCDLGIDQLSAAPMSTAVGEAWSRADGVGRFSISTVGFGGLGAGELIALATIACERGAAAIATENVRSVRRVVDTLIPIMAARGELVPSADPALFGEALDPETAVDRCH